MIDKQCRTCVRIRQGYCDGAEPDDTRHCYFYKRMTNADKIRSMTDEALAELFTDEYDGKKIFFCPVGYVPDCTARDCDKCFLIWLKQEIEK